MPTLSAEQQFPLVPKLAGMGEVESTEWTATTSLTEDSVGQTAEPSEAMVLVRMHQLVDAADNSASKSDNS